MAVDKNQVEEYVGSLKEARVKQIIDGLFVLIEPREAV